MAAPPEKEARTRCPFLREAQVKWCRAGPVRKQIVRHTGTSLHERCTSGEWMTCPTARVLHEDCPSLTHCPFLQETLAQYCSAAGISKFIPYNEVIPSRCSTDNHSYCQVFLTSRASPPASWPTRSSGATVPKNRNFLFTPNHMWIHVEEEGNLHIGVDTLLAEVLAKVGGVSFITSSSVCYPSVALSFGNTNVKLTFPLKMRQTGTNGAVVSDPSLITSFPYSRGWLFEGIDDSGDEGGVRPSLVEGTMNRQNADQWIADERSSLAQYVRDELVSMGATKMLTMMDGGALTNDWVSFLSKKKMAALFYDFFSPALFLPPFREGIRA